jgi:hypothetical protein
MSRTRAYFMVRIGGAVFAGAASLGWIMERFVDVQTPIDTMVNALARYALWAAAAFFFRKSRVQILGRLADTPLDYARNIRALVDVARLGPRLRLPLGASYLDSADGNLWGNAILPIVFKEDLRYFRLGSGTSLIAFSTPQPPPFGVDVTMVHGGQTTRTCWATSSRGYL